VHDNLSQESLCSSPFAIYCHSINCRSIYISTRLIFLSLLAPSKELINNSKELLSTPAAECIIERSFDYRWKFIFFDAQIKFSSVISLMNVSRGKEENKFLFPSFISQTKLFNSLKHFSTSFATKQIRLYRIISSISYSN
jgi:hypothetical protein